MSFKKRNADQQMKLPPGSKLSAYNGQLLISTGVPSLDDILGGGLPVGTLLLIKEDKATTYAQLLLKYFMAQGLASQHHCALASRDEDSGEMLRNLMWLATTDADVDEDEDEKQRTARSNADADRMKIAWRYSHLKKFETSVKAKLATPPPVPSDKNSATSVDKAEAAVPYCTLFDLTKRIPEELLKQANTTLLDAPNSFDDPDSDDYKTLLNDIRQLIIENNFSSAIPAPANTQRNILRLGIHSLASPSWRSKSPHDLFKFFHALHGLLRFSFGAAVVTIPAHLYEENPNFIRRIEYIADAVIEIESFAGSAIHNEASYTQNYHGFFHVQKVPVLNSLLPPSTKLSVLSAGGSNDLAFKLRRKRFAIETFHLPPEGGVSTRRTEPVAEKESSKKQSGSVLSSLAKISEKKPMKRIDGTPKGCGSLPGRPDPLEF
ncbi:Elongator complex protein 4 [Radiomyces spectabilis]|uniref:Elongator complex protein 4 n=1 Tax=Radiomyces spectabilis TaxID=64574 RepID=UPI00221F3529|nr:Elongator complex protein 4 [Radiomyces spectabilis]KAI8365911.1 Elongator complex protein 4 [Radiomyces spectabilis]